MQWAKSLILADKESIESRLESILTRMRYEIGDFDCIISDIEATGKLGNQFTKRNNTGENIRLSINDLILLVREDGQIIELNVLLITNNEIELVVVDGQSIDVLGNDNFVLSFIGDYVDLDPKLFNR